MVTIVGAGIAGLTAALLAARAGLSPRVLERASAPGGLAARHTFRGVSCDLGSHRLHAESLDVPVLAEMRVPCEIARRPRRGVVRLAGRFIPYPPSPAALMRGLGVVRSVSFGWSLARRRVALDWDGERFRGEDVGFERFVSARTGAAAYEAFYRPYAEKVWGVPPAELSQTVAKSRLSTLSPLSALAGLARSPRREFLYPAGGISTLVDHLLRQLEELRVRVEYGAEYDARLHGEGPVLHSGRLGGSAGGFTHRGLYLLYLALPVPRLREFETYYVPEARYRFGRVADLRNYSPRLAPPGETILVVEIPEGRLGGAARFDQGAALAEILDQLRDAGILPRGIEPLEAEQRFVPSVYPLHRRNWVERWRTVLGDVARGGNVYPFGRQGLFLHCNIHHCAQMATDLVAHVARGGGARAWVDRVDAYRGLRTVD